jgi:hypothetical protein
MVERWIGALQRGSFETTDVPWLDGLCAALMPRRASCTLARKPTAFSTDGMMTAGTG